MQTVTIVNGTNSSIMNITVSDDDVSKRDEMLIMNISLAIPSSVNSRIVAGSRKSLIAMIIGTNSKFNCYQCIIHICTYLHT